MADTVRTIRSMSRELERVRIPLTRALEEKLFGEEMPEVVTFAVLHAAMDEHLDGRPPSRTAIEARARTVDEPTRQIDDTLFGDEAFEGPFDLEALLARARLVLRGLRRGRAARRRPA